VHSMSKWMAAGALLLAGCTAPPPAAEPASSSAPPGSSYAQWDAAVSIPREDSYYPAKGDPRIDTLHYGLDLAWDPAQRRLTGTADIAFRVARPTDAIQLDLIGQLTVTGVTVDGAPATWRHPGKDLRISGPFVEDTEHTVRIEYAGTPRPVRAPTTRSDFSSVGWTTTAAGEVWTMQEPFGAHTWFPCNDQPADKAYYDITVRVPKRWVGVANGELTGNTVSGGTRAMAWHVAEPVSTYLTTIAIGNYEHTRLTSSRGLPIDLWTRNRKHAALLEDAPRILAWLEKRLGPYPFESLGFVVVPSRSAMETQSLITLGDTPYATSESVIQHEMAHQWYGDLVTPTDWRDMWMNEGMTMFLQFAYEADRAGESIDDHLAPYAAFEVVGRGEDGPPGAYDRDSFGSGNVYLSPALMWNEVRHQLGDSRFWELVRNWPRVHAYGNATRQQYYQWLHDEYGLDPAFLDAWIMGKRTPERTDAR